jgi:hypothetical protein
MSHCMHETSEHMHAAMQRQAAGFVWIRLGTAGSVLLAMLERAACMLQHGELGRPFTSSRQLGPAGSRWVGQLSWVGPVGFHSRTTLSESNTLAHRQLLLGRSGLLKSPQSSARPILENCGCADAVSSDVGRCRGVTGCGDSGRKHRRYCGPHVHLNVTRQSFSKLFLAQNSLNNFPFMPWRAASTIAGMLDSCNHA